MKARWTDFYKPLLVLLIGYSVVHFISFGIFYNGFSSSFSFIASQLPNWLTFFGDYILGHPFNSKFLLFSALKNVIFFTTTCLIFSPFISNVKNLSWRHFEFEKWIKLLSFFVAFILCWELITYDFNYYLNSGFYIDRIVLILFTIGILYHPIFIPAFIITALLYRSQFNFPIGGFPLFDKRVLFDLLLLSYAFLVANRFLKIKTSLFFILVFCIVGGNYFSTFQAKILNSPHGYEWLTENKLNWFFLNSHARGWLNFLTEESILQLAMFLEKWSILLQSIVLIIEGSAIFILFRKSVTRYLLLAFMLMHLAIFSIGSMLFWKWIAIDLFLIVFLWKAPEGLLNQLFKKSNRLASLLFISLSAILFQNFLIGWHDTPYNQLYSYQVVCEDGSTYEFSKNNFNPYHQLIQYDKFNYLNPYKILKISGFGYTSKYHLARAVRTSNWEEFLQLKEKYGNVELNQMDKDGYVEFISVFFKNYNEQLKNNQWYTSMAAPHHIYNNVLKKQYDKQSKVILYRVVYQEYFIEKNILSIKRSIPLLEVKI